MSTQVTKRSQKAGLPPGALVHVGERKSASTELSILSYDEREFREQEIETIEQSGAFRERKGVTWIRVEGIHQVEVLERIGDYIGLHPLVMEDILNTDQRPKVEDYGEYLYIVVRMVYFDKDDEMARDQISLVLGRNFVISFQEKELDVFDPIIDRIRLAKGLIRKRGADFLAYCLLDAVVDNYFAVFEKVEEGTEELEDRLITDPPEGTLQTIQNLKRQMIVARRSVWPLREVVGTLQRRESPLIKESTVIYLRDIYDHIVQMIDTIETFQDTLSGMLDIYLSSMSNKMNEVMKVLTILGSLFIPLTLISGIYGMNFKFMPELSWRWGYPAVLLLMVTVSLFMLLFIRKKKWL
ncbi:MAG: magnesium/cobalt transporter CorA [Deltaproteobacteria bacterium]|nr:magnesium/cobalt transporter CorA [Deltaproteobacteria bacterium]MBW2120396.1 magnesium/cobalt transporter CorA [Deltaproteobacteria bacterium]